MFVELHMIQNFVPSNLNRDDTGSPKDCIFGGQRRARVSSQCLKRSIRKNDLFAETTQMPTSKRTQYLAVEVAKKLVRVHGKAEEEAMPVAIALMSDYTTPNKKKPEQSAVLVFISDDEVAAIADMLATHWDEVRDEKLRPGVLKEIVKGMVKQYQNRVAAPDIALFGRMLANEPKLNLEAACQVAHAISTHRVSMEMDYFTAVDDVREDADETGAGHINTFGFNSSCFYRYARIDWNQLLRNLNGNVDLALRTVEGFLRASIAAIPSGKQNSTAPLNPPSFLLGVVRTDGMGWNLANAFEKPVVASYNTSLVKESINALDNYWGKLETVYGGQTLATVTSLNLEGESLTHLNGDRAAANLGDWIAAILAALSTSSKLGGSKS